MGMQLVIRAENAESVREALGDVASRCEVFPLLDGHFGISVPTKVVDAMGEQLLHKRIASLKRFDLWSGNWN